MGGPGGGAVNRPVDWHVLDLPGDPIDGDPAPGQPWQVQDRARAATLMGEDAARAERDVRGLAGDQAVLTWIGAAGDVFRGALGDFPGQLGKLADSYGRAGDALRRWADRLGQAQDQADRALAQGRQARAELDALTSQLQTALIVSTAASATSSRLTNPTTAPGAPPPDPTQVRQAVQSASAAAQQVSALHASVAGAEGRLRAARSLADQARELRRDGARTTKRELHDAADAGIKPDSGWKHFTDAVSQVWDVAVKVATVVAVVVAVIALVVGGPLVWGILLAASLVLLTDSLIRYGQGKGSLLDVGLNLLAVVPGVGLVGRAGRLLRASESGARMLAAGGRGLAAARGGLTDAAAALRSGLGRRVAVLGGEAGSASVHLLTGGLSKVSEHPPGWLRRLREGQQWHVDEQTRLAGLDRNNVAELHVARPAGAPLRSRLSHNRVDVYNQPERQIVSMKHTQLSEVTPQTAQRYIDEAVTKYAPGTVISNVDSNPLLMRGERLAGRVILHVPKQTEPIPASVVSYAEERGVQIRQAPK